MSSWRTRKDGRHYQTRPRTSQSSVRMSQKGSSFENMPRSSLRKDDSTTKAIRVNRRPLLEAFKDSRESNTEVGGFITPSGLENVDFGQKGKIEDLRRPSGQIISRFHTHQGGSKINELFSGDDLRVAKNWEDTTTILFERELGYKDGKIQTQIVARTVQTKDMPREEMVHYYDLGEEMIAKSKIENQEFTKMLISPNHDLSKPDSDTPEYVQAKSDYAEARSKVESYHAELMSNYGSETVLKEYLKHPY